MAIRKRKRASKNLVASMSQTKKHYFFKFEKQTLVVFGTAVVAKVNSDPDFLPNLVKLIVKH